MNFRKAANLVFGIGALTLGISILLPGLIGLGVAALHARKAEKVKAVAASGHTRHPSIAIEILWWMTARSLASGFLMPKDADQSTKTPLPEEVESGHGEVEVGWLGAKAKQAGSAGDAVKLKVLDD